MSFKGCENPEDGKTKQVIHATGFGYDESYTACKYSCDEWDIHDRKTVQSDKAITCEQCLKEIKKPSPVYQDKGKWYQK